MLSQGGADHPERELNIFLQARPKGWRLSFGSGKVSSLKSLKMMCEWGCFAVWKFSVRKLCLFSRFSHICVCVLSRLLTSGSATSWTVALQAPLSMGFPKARILEWVAFSTSRGSSQPRDRTHLFCVSCIGRWVLCHLSRLGSPSLI